MMLLKQKFIDGDTHKISLLLVGGLKNFKTKYLL